MFETIWSIRSQVTFLDAFAYNICLLTNVSTAKQRQDVIENHERRRDHLAKLLQQTKDKVADHDAGRNLLEDEEYKKHARRIPLYERKLERLSKPLDERVSILDESNVTSC